MMSAGESAVLRYVTREVEGNIETTTVRYDAKDGENKKKLSKVKDPVIVFLPNGTSQVFSRASAERKGFLETPEIINFESVTDASTVVGKFKFAMFEKDRLKYWQEMEQLIISRCTRKQGHPLPLDAMISKKSLFVGALTEEKENA